MRSNTRGEASRVITALVAVGLSSGCASQLRAASAGQIGCRPDDVVISEDTGGWGMSRTWIATCDGEHHSCSAVATGKNSSQVACSPLGGRPTSTATTAGADAPAPATYGAVVTRGFDEERKAPFVEGQFEVAFGITLNVLGSPARAPGQLLFAATGRIANRGLRECQVMSALINAQPLQPMSHAFRSTVRVLDLESRFEAARFEQLSKPFPEFSVVVCKERWQFSPGQLQELQKLLVIYADLAKDASAQSAPAAEPPAAPAPTP